MRTELFRISPAASGDKAWRDALDGRVVKNILDVPEFKRYCLPFNPQQAAEPAIVIPFSSTVEFRKNFFGRDLAGGDKHANAEIIRRILRGDERGPKRDAGLLNAGAALFVAGRTTSFADGWELAAATIDGGAAGKKLAALTS